MVLVGIVRVLLVLSLVAVHDSETTGTFEWTLLRYDNPGGKLNDGTSCDWVGNCDHRFTFGLDNLYGNDDAKDTPLLTERTGVFEGENSNTFSSGADNHGVYNPITYNFNSWQGGLLLKVYVLDDDSPLKPDYVDSIVYRLLVTPSASSLTSTAVRTEMKSRTSLTFTYRVYCNEYYFGDDCATYCQGQDDNINGHYTCDVNGNKICLNGWEGEANNCRDRQNDCEVNACLNGALCLDGIRSYTCQCKPGFAGTFCGTNINECLSQPCKNGGTCIDGINDYTCVCNPSYVGKDCSQTACVVLSPCKNGGTCYGSGRCLCPPTFIGDSCEIPLCNKTGCLNGGKCSVDGSCVCPAGINGSMCDVVLCNAIGEYCMNGGFCKNGNCVCPIGFAGLTCSENIVCKYTKCLNNGQCRPTINDLTNSYEPKCFCPANYGGEFCQDKIEILIVTPAPSRVTQNEPKTYSSLEILFIFFIVTTIFLVTISIVLAVLLCRYRKRKSDKTKRQKTITSVSSDYSTSSEVFSEFGKSTLDDNFSNPALSLSMSPKNPMTSVLNIYEDGDDKGEESRDSIYSKLNEGEIEKVKCSKDNAYEIIIPEEVPKDEKEENDEKY